MRRATLSICFLLLSTLASAQVTTVTKNAKFSWVIATTDIASVNNWSFQLELDNITQSKLLASVCTLSGENVTCTASMPPITTTTHSARLRTKGLNQDGVLVTTVWSNKVIFKVTAATTIINILAPQDLTVIEQ